MLDEKELAEKFARNLRGRRNYLGLSQVELAERTGIDRGTISQWERADTTGRMPNGVSSAAQLCVALGISLDEALGL